MSRITFLFLVFMLAATLGLSACTNMNKTQQGSLSGAAVGAAAGLGISALAGGNKTVGTLIGSGVGALVGGIYGNSKEDEHHRGRYNR